MSDSENQYNSPEAPVVPDKKQVVGGLTETMFTYLKEASPWLKFIGILGFIGCGLMILGSLSFVFISIAASAMLDEFAAFPIWLVTPLYFASGALLFFPSLFTYRFGEKIRKYQFSNADEDLEEAFKNNKSLWKFYGIMCIISLAATPVLLIIMAVVVVASASNFF